MDFAVKYIFGMGGSTLYFSSLNSARRVARWIRRDGGSAVIFRKVGENWEAIKEELL